MKLLLGLFLYALGIVVSMKANLGFAPWEVFHYGLGKTIDLTIGTVSILVGLIICLCAVWMGEKIGLGTILNMILIGVFMDLLLMLSFIPEVNGLFMGIIMIITGLFIISFGSYFYIASGFGAGPRDSLMVALQRKTGLPVGLCRGFLEGTVVSIGWLLGGPVGLGTVLAAFGIGFCIQTVFVIMKFDATSVKHETLNATRKYFMSLYSKNQ